MTWAPSWLHHHTVTPACSRACATGLCAGHTGQTVPQNSCTIEFCRSPATATKAPSGSLACSEVSPIVLPEPSLDHPQRLLQHFDPGRLFRGWLQAPSHCSYPPSCRPAATRSPGHQESPPARITSRSGARSASGLPRRGPSSRSLDDQSHRIGSLIWPVSGRVQVGIGVRKIQTWPKGSRSIDCRAP